MPRKLSCRKLVRWVKLLWAQLHKHEIDISGDLPNLTHAQRRKLRSLRSRFEKAKKQSKEQGCRSSLSRRRKRKG